MQIIGDGVTLGDVAPTLDQLRAFALAAADAEYGRRMALGFPHDFGTSDAPDPQTLQVCAVQNQADWLVLDTAARDAIEAGAGDQDAQPPIRCTSNAMRTVSWSACRALLADMRTWGGAMRAALWAIKDRIDQAADADALAAIDVTAGYPGA